jgi:beta/gamma crystallin
MLPDIPVGNGDRLMSQTRSARVIALAVAGFALGVGVSVAQSRQAGGVGITVYDDVNFQGAALTFAGDVADLRDSNLNDRISSLQVAPGESWEVCENTNFGGRCLVVSGSELDLRARGWNDMISSIRRVPGRDGRRARDDRAAREDRVDVSITVFDDVNFQGAPMTFRGDVADLREFGLNDRISSLQVPSGESWEVCENTNFGGRCVVVAGSDRDLRPRGWNDIISSMRPVQGREGRRYRDDRNDRDTAFVVPPSPRSEIVLFDQPGYRGGKQNVTEAAAGLGAFANRARSVQILDGVWELCEQSRWNGRCVRVSSSVPDLGRIGLSGVASARPLDRSR